MNKINLCALDVDGLIASFGEAACAKHGIELPNPIPSDTYLYDVVGSKKAFWAKCASREFFASIPLYPWSKKLVETVDKSGVPWIFLTKAPMGSESLAGKEEWVKRNFPRYTNKIWIMRGTKSYMAGPGRLLIDDKGANGQEWLAANKDSLFYHWSELHPSQVDEAEKRIEEIRKILTNKD